MNRKYYIHFITCILFGFISLELFAQEQSIHWVSDYDQAITQATETHKNVFAVFTSELCHPCQQLKKFILTKPEIIQYVNDRMIPLAIDIDTQEPLANSYRVAGVPTTMLIRNTKEEIDRFGGGDITDEFAHKYLVAIIDMDENGKTLSELEENLRLDPSNPNIMLKIMKKAFSQTLEQKAFEYEKRIENEHNDFFVQNKAEIYYEISAFYWYGWDRRDLAIPYLKEILNIQNADRRDAYFMLSYIYFSTNKIEEGFVILEEGLAIYSDDLKLNVFYLDECVDTKQRIDQGIEYGLTAIQFDIEAIDKAYLYNLLAHLYEIKTDKAEAIRMIDKAIELDPKNEEYQRYRDTLLSA